MNKIQSNTLKFEIPYVDKKLCFFCVYLCAKIFVCTVLIFGFARKLARICSLKRYSKIIFQIDLMIKKEYSELSVNISDRCCITHRYNSVTPNHRSLLEHERADVRNISPRVFFFAF